LKFLGEQIRSTRLNSIGVMFVSSLTADCALELVFFQKKAFSRESTPKKCSKNTNPVRTSIVENIAIYGVSLKALAK
jgi:hypothetical protein